MTTQVNERQILMTFDSLHLHFLVNDGKEVLIAAPTPHIQGPIQDLFYGHCMAALLLYKGLLPFHGNALSHSGLAIGLVGCSGAGKSTLTTALWHREMQVLADDVIAISTTKNSATVYPSGNSVKLRPNSLKILGLNAESLASGAFLQGKYVLPMNRYTLAPVPIKALYYLQQGLEDTTSVEPIEGVRKFLILRKHIYHAQCLFSMGRSAEHLKQCETLSALPLWCITRPTNEQKLEELADHVFRHIQGGFCSNAHVH